jgi:CubicO group peptidase (beta-lactamase class C family)
MTATAATKLAELGELDLSAPIQTYCPTYPDKHRPITARDLISHTSGIRHFEGRMLKPSPSIHGTTSICLTRWRRWSDMSSKMAAGGWLTTAPDLVRFMNAWMAEKLVCVPTMKSMLEP